MTPVYLFFLVIIVIFLAMSIKILNEYERGVIFRLGRVLGRAKGPGLILLIPIIDRMVKVSLRTVVHDVPPQDVITRDNVTIKVNAVVYFRVIDPMKSIIDVENYLYATSQLSQTTLRSVLGQAELDDLLAHREKINVLGEELAPQIERFIALQSIDRRWKEHLYEMDGMREGIGYQAYAQKDPLVEYKFQAFTLFQELIKNINTDLIRNIFRVRVVQPALKKQRIWNINKVQHDEYEQFGARGPYDETAPAEGGDGGEPVFAKLDAELGRMLGIGAVKGVEVGAGFAVKDMTGIQNNDQMRAVNGKVVFDSNNAGGITGGLTTGQPIVVRLAVKPTPTIAKPQQTIDKYTMENKALAAITRRDPTIVARLWPVAENYTALVILDHLMMHYGYQGLRSRIERS